MPCYKPVEIQDNNRISAWLNDKLNWVPSFQRHRNMQQVGGIQRPSLKIIEALIMQLN